MKRDFECRGCKHADIQLWTLPTCRAASNYANVFRELKVYCRLKKKRVEYPQEICSQRTPIQYVRIDSYA